MTRQATTRRQAPAQEWWWTVVEWAGGSSLLIELGHVRCNRTDADLWVVLERPGLPEHDQVPNEREARQPNQH